MSAVDTRPAFLTAIHHYNLRNQGWPTSFSLAPNEAGSGAPTTGDPLIYTRDSIGVFPSNADTIYNAKADSATTPEVIGSYSPWVLRKFSYGNTPAAKGRFILNAFNRNRQAASGIEGIYDPEEDLDPWRAVSVAFYAGRAFYLKPNGVLLFSQLLTDDESAERCYQEADPSAEEINDLVASDGGEVRIRDAGEGLNLIAVADKLYVFCTNGVWYISGGNQSGFTAADFQVQKLTNSGVNSAESVVAAGDLIFYWGRSGIYVIRPNEVTGFPEAINISENTIQTYYLGISSAAKKNAKGFYDPEKRKILWAFNDDSNFDGVNWRYRYSEILYYDLVLQAFYTQSFQTGTRAEGFPAHVAGMFTKSAEGIRSDQEEVTNGGVVVSDGGEEVTTTVFTVRTGESGIKFLAFNEESTDTFRYTVSELTSGTFRDWSSLTEDGIVYPITIEGGADILGDPTVEKYGNYIYLFFERTESTIDADGELENPSSCFFRVKWNWSDSESSGKWTDLQQGYRFNRAYLGLPSSSFNYGHEVIMTKTKLRGNGKSISIRFEGETGKDFRLLGWAIPFSAVPLQ